MAPNRDPLTGSVLRVWLNTEGRMVLIRPVPKPKTIRLEGQAYTAFRKEVCDRAHSRCEICGKYAPLLIDGYFDLYGCGHVSHIKSRGAGGSDTLDNVKWSCSDCHYKRHSKGLTKKF